MSLPRCSQCGAELVSEARFCRQCGAAIRETDAVDSSEMPTAVLDKRIDPSATQRLDPRPTTPGPGSFAPSPVRAHSAKTKLSRRWVPATLILSLVLLVVIGIISAVAYVRISNHSRTADTSLLIYSGARIVADLSKDDGRQIHLQTGDSLERVAAWYDNNLKPTKTMRLTSTSLLLKNQNVTATIVSEADQTSILIKQQSTP